jgi:G patch domain-containing protein 1
MLSNLNIHIADDDTHYSQYDPASLQYMLDFFRNVAQTIPTDTTSQDGGEGVHPLDPVASRTGSASSVSGSDESKRAGIIVLREDLDFYVIPPVSDIGPKEMMEVKRAAAKALLSQDGIFSGLKKSDEPGTTEAHLIEMLTAGYVSLPVFSPLTSLLTLYKVASTTTTSGAIGRASQTRQLSAV